MDSATCFGVFRVLKDGREVYCSRTATYSEKLAREIAADFTEGRFVRPDGSLGYRKPHPHVAKPLGSPS